MWKTCIVLMGTCVAMVAQAAGIEWMSDMEAAAKKAAREDKMLLVEFTGSDWCQACIAQKKKVLDKPEFAEWAQRYYIPVVVNIPQNAALVGGEEQLAKNKKFCDDYGIKIFPSLMVMSPELVLLGGCSGMQASVAATIAALEASNEAVKSYRAAMEIKATHIHRARKLYALYQSQPESIRRVNYPLVRLIAMADKDNETGIQDVYKPVYQMKTLEKELALAVSFEDRLRLLDAALADAMPVNKRGILSRKEMLLKVEAVNIMKNPGSVADVVRARELSLQAADCMSDEAVRNKQRKMIDEFFADPAALFEKYKSNGAK